MQVGVVLSRRGSPVKRIANVLSISQRVRLVAPDGVYTCLGHRLAHATLAPIALPIIERLGCPADAAPHHLVAGRAPSGRNFDLGLVLPVARLFPRRRIGVLFFCVYLHDSRLRRCVAGQAVANARTNRKPDGCTHAQFVHRLLLPRRKSHLPVAESHGCFRFRRIGVRLVSAGCGRVVTNRKYSGRLLPISRSVFTNVSAPIGSIFIP